MFKLNSSLAFKWLTLQIVGLGLMLFLAGVYQYQTIRDAAYKAVEDSGDAVAQTIRERLVENPELFNPEGLQAVSFRLVKKVSNIRYMAVIDHSRQVIVDTANKNSPVSEVIDENVLNELLQEEGETSSFYQTDEGKFLRLSYTIEGRYDPSRKNNIAGVLTLDMNLSNPEKDINAAFARTMGVLAGLLFLFWAVQYGLARRGFLRGLNNLTLAAERFGRGDFSTRAQVKTRDELGQLATAFNRMATEVEQSSTALKTEIRERRHAEDALRKSEERYRQIVENAGDIIYRTDPYGRFTLINAVAVRLMKRPEDEIIGLPFVELIHPDYRAKAAEFYQKQFSEKVQETYYEFPIIDIDGKQIWIGQNVQMICEDNRIAGFQAVARDITERKRAEEALEKEREFLAAVFENVTDGIVACDANGVLMLFNRATQEIHGLPGEAIPADQWAEHFDLYLPDGKTLMKKEQIPLFRALEEGSVHDIEMVIAPKKLPARRLIASGRAIFDAQGKKLGAVVAMHDITERKKAESKLFELAAIVESSEDAIISKSLDDIITNWNAGAERIFLYKKEEIVGKHGSILLPSEKVHEEPNIIQRIKRGERIEHFETVRVRKDGRQIPVSLTISPIKDADGNIVGISKIARDVTGRKRTEEKLKNREAQLNEAQQIAHLGSWEWDIRAGKVSWSDEEFRIFGVQPKEFAATYEAYLERVHPDDLNRVIRIIRRALQEKEFSSFEHRIVRPDGQVRTVQAGGKIILDEDGNPIRILGTTLDITERKRMEEALAEAAQRERAMIDNALDVICTIDVEGKFVTVSPASFKIWGYFPEELIGRRYIELVAPEDVPKTNEEAKVIMSGRATTNFENCYQHKNGSTVDMLWTAFWSEDDQLMFCVARDNTERKRLEKELEQARDNALESTRLKSEFLANMSHEIRTPMNGVIGMTGLLLDTDLSEEQRDFAETIRSSADSLLTVINDILDFSKIEAGKLNFETIDFDLQRVVEDIIEMLAERAAIKELELISNIDPDVATALRGDPGRLRQVLVNLLSNGLKFTEAGEVVLSVALEKEDEKGATLKFTVSDTGIGISTEAQRKLFQSFVQADGSTTRRYGGTGLGLAISKQLVEAMGGQIGVESKMGEGSAFWFTARFKKQPAGAAARQPEKARLESARILVVDDNATNRKVLLKQTASWGMRATAAESAKIALEILREAAAKGNPFDVALLDLQMPEMDGFDLARAIKSDPAISAVKLVLMPSFGKRGDAQLARDLGISAYLMKPVKQSQLFDCLAVVLAESSTEDESAARAKLAAGQRLEESHLANGRRVLVVEDNPVNQRVALGQLAKLGISADAVGNGLEAINSLEQISYDIVLMDCQMPEMDGYQATAEIRRRENSTKHTIIVAMTANAMEGEREKCIAAGMDDYLKKPVDVEDLRKMFERWLPENGKKQTAIENESRKPSAEEDSSSPVDVERLRDSANDDDEFMRDLIKIYSEQMSENLGKLKAAVKIGAAEEIKLIAHTLVGASVTCGMVAVVKPLRELERAGEANLLNEAPPLIAQIERELERIEKFLESFLQLVRV